VQNSGDDRFILELTQFQIQTLFNFIPSPTTHQSLSWVSQFLGVVGRTFSSNLAGDLKGKLAGDDKIRDLVNKFPAFDYTFRSRGKKRAQRD
jgi:hypothetical protein